MLREVNGNDFAGVGGSETYTLFADAFVVEVGDEKAIAGNKTLEAFEQPAAGARFHFYTVFHKEHGTSLGYHGFLGIEFNFNDLNTFTFDLIINFV